MIYHSVLKPILLFGAVVILGLLPQIFFGDQKSAISQYIHSLGPVGLSLEFLITVALVSLVVWYRYSDRSPVFWKKTDYFYFTLTILGGAAGVADIAVSSLNRDLQNLQMELIAEKTNLHGLLNVALTSCKAEVIKAQKEAANSDSSATDSKSSGKDSPAIPQVGRNGRFNTTPEQCNSVESILIAVEGRKFEEFDQRIATMANAPPFPPGISASGILKLFRHSEGFVDDYFRTASYIQVIVETERKRAEISKAILAYSYFAVFKSLSPILLGLGIGVRLARTRYDVRTEKLKEDDERAKKIAEAQMNRG